MTTIEKVVKMWNETCSNQKNKASEITQGHSYGRTEKEAVIKLSDTHPSEPWSERTCYVFSFNSDKNNNLAKIEISFQRRIKEHPNTQAFYEFLNEKFNDEKFILGKGRINPNHLVLKRVFPLNSSAQDICNGMEELIKLTQKPICKFLAGKNREEFLTEKQKKIFSKILEKHGIENEKTELHGKCKEIYIQTIKILRNLSIGNEDFDIDDFEVSHYTKKNIAQSLVIASKDKKECDEFRLYYIHGANDPSEGKTLLSFLGIKSENLKLPEDLPFVTCFSLEVDSLNQFRLYGNDTGKEATGVSILFKPSFFNEKTYPLYRCVYIEPNGRMSISFSKKEEGERYSKEVKNRQKEVKELFEELKSKIQELNINKTELARDLLINIRYIAKDCAFTEERECRIIDMRNRKDESIEIDGERLYVKIGKVKDHIAEIYFAPLSEGMEVFEIKTDIKCTRSRHPYKSTRL